MSNEFTRSHVGEGGNSLKDSAYQLTSCVILPRGATAKDAVVNITQMVGFIRIYESLFNPSLCFEIGIRDDYNFFEEFGLSGDEVIVLEFETKTYGQVRRTHEYEVHVTKIDDYARGDSQVHAYTLVGTSSHAFYAPFKKANMVCHGMTTDSIAELCNTIDITPVEYPPGRTCITKTHKVFGMKNPLKAALELLSVSVDEHGTPYFLYQTLSNVVYLTPLSWINDRRQNPVYRTFTYTDHLTAPGPNSEFEHFERSSQIVKLTSNIGTSPVKQLVQGGRGSRVLYEMNLESKEISRNTSLFEDPVRVIDPDFEPYVKHRYTQPAATNDPDHPPISVLKARHADDISAHIAAYDSFSHQFTVMGDMLLNPGRTIHLQFPKALDPITNPKQLANGEYFDKRLTKDYVIFQAVHTFQEGKHTTDITAKANDCLC